MAVTVPFVAVIDDEEAVRKALKRLLRAAGLQAEGYASGKEFLASDAQADCVVLDLHMPVMNGQTVLENMRRAGRRVPVVAITAHDTPETRAQCMAAGASAYLRKPLDDRLLLNAISVALAKARPAF